MDNFSKTSKLRDWYKETYPTDELGDRLDKDITLSSVMEGMKNGEDIYDLMGVGDSVIRERVFEKLSELYYRGDYNKVYRMWLDR